MDTTSRMTTVVKYTAAKSNTISTIKEQTATEAIRKSECYYIKNKKTGNVLFISPTMCRLMKSSVLNKIIATDDIVDINYTTVFNTASNNKCEIPNKRIFHYWYRANELSPYGELIYFIYRGILGIDTAERWVDYRNNKKDPSGYEQWRAINVPNSENNILQEFFINKQCPKLATRQKNSWNNPDDPFYSSVDSDYDNSEFGMLFSLNGFKFHKKNCETFIEMFVDPEFSSDNSGSYYSNVFGDYLHNINNHLELSTCGLFNILNPNFETLFEDFVKKLEKFPKLLKKYNDLRDELLERVNEDKIFMFSVSYQNRFSISVSEIYDFDLIKRNFDYHDSDNLGETIQKVTEFVASNNFIKVKRSSYGCLATYINKDIFTDKNAHIEISLKNKGGNYIVLSFKNKRHKCEIPVSNDILNELEGLIPEEQLTMLKCEYVLCQ